MQLIFVFLFQNKEFIPRGRQAVKEHPGPLVKNKQTNISSDHLLRHRLQNVNISNDDHTPSSSMLNTKAENEQWCIQEIYENVATVNDKNYPIFMSEFAVNSEEELYFMGNTAVWTRGIANSDGVLPRTSFTCDTTIKHAFFCSNEFIRTTEPDKHKSKADLDALAKQSENLAGICLIGKLANLEKISFQI